MSITLSYANTDRNLIACNDLASAALHALLHSPDFTISMLLWAAKTAHASGMKSLLQAVLSALLDVCRGKTAVALNVDTMVLVRCLIRLNVTALDEIQGNAT